jgi:hypothetical protein
LALAYAAVVGVSAALGHPYPFGTGIPPAPGVLTSSWPWQAAAAVATAGALIAAALAVALWSRPVPGRLLARASAVFAALYGAAFLGLVADSLLLSFLGYLPVIIAKLVTDPAWVLGRPIAWAALANQFALLGGAMLWGALAVGAVRRTSAARGRGPDDGARAARAARRWGAASTWTAVAIPLLYAATRLAWAAGIPLGVPQAFVDGLHGSGDVLTPLGLASMAVVGAVLTAGLVARWGERIPAWVPWAGGRRVPIAAAVVPALLVAAAIFPAGMQLTALSLGLTPGVRALLTAQDWAAYGPTLLWPLWSVALATAAVAYGVRRSSEPGTRGPAA